MKIPKKWDNIPLRNFVAYQEASELELKEFEMLYAKVCAIMDCSLEEAKNMTIADKIDLEKLIKKPIPNRLRKRFKLNGVTYRRKKIKAGKYVAIKNAAKRGTLKNLHHILFLVCEPVKFGFRKQFPFIGWKAYEFEADEIKKRIIDFKELPMSVANPLSLFFLTFSKRLKSLLEDYSIKSLKEMQKKMEDIQASLEKDMDGM